MAVLMKVKKHRVSIEVVVNGYLITNLDSRERYFTNSFEELLAWVEFEVVNIDAAK